MRVAARQLKVLLPVAARQVGDFSALVGSYVGYLRVMLGCALATTNAL